MKRILVVHPLLFAAWPVLFTFSQNQEHLALANLWPPLLLLLGLASIVFLLLTLILRDARRSGLILSLFLFLFFSFGQAMRAASLSATPLLVAWAVIFVAGSTAAFRTRRRLDTITKLLNAVVCVLVLLSAGTIVLHAIQAGGASGAEDVLPPPEIVVEEAAPPGTLPDIYYIILDGYARADVLEELYGYDNSEFLEFLAQRGFYVAENSRANYVHTSLSLASSLNLSYLDDLAAHIGPGAQDRDPLAAWIEHSAAIEFLRQRGYLIVALPSIYPPTVLEEADVQIGDVQTTDALQVGLLMATPLPWLLGQESRRNAELAAGDRILDNLGRLPGTADIQSPHLVFAHIPSPHPPFLFHADGTRVEPDRPRTGNDGSHFFEEGGTRDEYLSGYVGQVAFINTQVQAMIDDLLARSSGRAIVILQADHGSGLGLDWDDADNTDLDERFSILNAIYLPDGVPDDLYPGISPVNTFRLIFNHTFGAGLEYLQDRSFFSTWHRPYDLMEVTDRLQGNPPPP